MSIILGPYDDQRGGSTSDQRDSTEDKDFFVFGYACKLFRDDAKALLESSGQMLIPWMGDSSLMVDRYDIRNRLEDKGQFGLKPNLPRRRTEEAEELEERLDQERYLALGVDILEHELLEEETRKRGREGSDGYQAVGFTYSDSRRVEKLSLTGGPHILPPRLEHPPTSTVDIAENETDRFVIPAGLVIPTDIAQPLTKKLHAIIERTAGFVARQGTQMEIMIKAKQKYNALFSFLSLSDPLHSYYQHLMRLIASGHYTPERGCGGVLQGRGEAGGMDSAVSVEEPRQMLEKGAESESEDSDVEGFELHPLLRISATPRSSPKPPSTKDAPPVTSTLPSTTTTAASTSSAAPLASFYTKSLNVNAAPSLERGEGRMSSGPHHGHPHPSSLMSQQTVAPDGQSHHLFQCHQYHEGYSLHPQPSDYSSQESLEAFYHRLSAEHISNQIGTAAPFHLPPGHTPGPPPPPPDLQPIIDKTAEYVARNSEEFERTVLEKHCGDPKFGFLNPWDKYYSYYKLQLQLNKERAAEQALAAIERDFQRMEREAATQRGEVIQKLSQSGAVSFKLQPKKASRVLEVGMMGQGLDPEEGEGEEEEDGEGHAVSNDQQYESYPSVQDGHTAEQDSSQVTYYSGNHCEIEPTNHLPVEPSLPDQAHYSAEGMYYSTGSNGEATEGSREESPAAKRAKTDTSTDVMDNKVQEFLSQVKAVLDT